MGSRKILSFIAALGLTGSAVAQTIAVDTDTLITNDGDIETVSGVINSPTADGRDGIVMGDGSTGGSSLDSDPVLNDGRDDIGMGGSSDGDPLLNDGGDDIGMGGGSDVDPITNGDTVAGDIGGFAPDGPYSRLSPGGQKIANALHDAQVSALPDMDNNTLSLDEIAMAKQHNGWGRMFKEMQREGMLPEDVKNLGQLVSGKYQPSEPLPIDVDTVDVGDANDSDGRPGVGDAVGDVNDSDGRPGVGDAIGDANDSDGRPGVGDAVGDVNDSDGRPGIGDADTTNPATGEGTAATVKNNKNTSRSAISKSDEIIVTAPTSKTLSSKSKKRHTSTKSATGRALKSDLVITTGNGGQIYIGATSKGKAHGANKTKAAKAGKGSNPKSTTITTGSGNQAVALGAGSDKYGNRGASGIKKGGGHSQKSVKVHTGKSGTHSGITTGASSSFSGHGRNKAVTVHTGNSGANSAASGIVTARGGGAGHGRQGKGKAKGHNKLK